MKPENFLLSTKDDEAPLKATDFGLSVFYKPGEMFTDVVGSAYYVAPEVGSCSLQLLRLDSTCNAFPPYPVAVSSMQNPYGLCHGG